jgi:hypothetical protein
MGASGMWVLLVARDEDLEPYRARFAALLAEHAARPDVQALWRGWRDQPELVHGYTAEPGGTHRSLDQPNEAFLHLGAGYPIADPDLDLVRDCQNLAEDGRDAIVVNTRKVDPVAALFHGLGPARAASLPGFLGNFLLTSAEVRAAEPAVAEAFRLDQAERAAVLGRIEQWLETGDTGTPAEQILRAVPAIWGRATRLGLGVCATSEAV